MTEGKHRCIEIDRPTVLLGIDELLAWCIAQSERQFGGADFQWVTSSHTVLLGERHEVEFTTGFILFRFQLECGTESELLLPFQFSLLTVIKHHLVHLCPFECSEHVILICTQK